MSEHEKDIVEDVAAAVHAARLYLSMRQAEMRAFAQVVAHATDELYAALRRLQQVRVDAGEKPVPIPCSDCLTEIPGSAGAGAYTRGYVHHELIYDGDELPYATCGTCPTPLPGFML